eukprot:4528056-Prymnesium_polylepis.1
MHKKCILHHCGSPSMTTSHSKVTHQSVYNMPFEHHGEGAWSSRGHAQHRCGPSRCGRPGTKEAAEHL